MQQHFATRGGRSARSPGTGHDHKTIKDYLDGMRTPGERVKSTPGPFEEVAEYARIPVG